MALRLNEWSKTLTGMQAYCVKAYAEALEVSNRMHVFIINLNSTAAVAPHK
jgi:chaperonin GroEL (HSP60 family)